MNAALDSKTAELVAEAYKAPRVSAVQAKLAWEAESGVFIDLRTPGALTIDGFERIPAGSIAKSVSKIEEAAKTANTKDIYFLDFSGYQSSVAVNLLKESPQLNGYNLRVIDGGFGEWMNDNGPATATNPQLDAFLTKLRAETKTDTPNEPYLAQLISEFGIEVTPHEMLTYDEATNSVIENPLILSDSPINKETFAKFVNKFKL